MNGKALAQALLWAAHHKEVLDLVRSGRARGLYGQAVEDMVIETLVQGFDAKVNEALQSEEQ